MEAPHATAASAVNEALRAARPAPTIGELALLGVVYTAITTWWLWPLPLHATTHGPYFDAGNAPSVADFFLIVWALAWDTHALFTDPLRLFHANSFYPTPLSLAYSEHFLGYLPMFAPTYGLSGNPILATNVLIFVSYPLCALAMYALARRWCSPPAAALAGFFFAFSLTRLYHLPHFHQLGVQYFPLAILFTERWLETGRSRELPWLAASLALQLLSSIYLAYALVFTYVPYLVLALWRWRSRVDRRRVVGLVATGCVALLPFAAATIPYIQLRALGLVPSYDDGHSQLGLLPYFSMIAINRYLFSRGVGIVGYLLAMVALVPPWRGERRWPTTLALVVAIVGLVVAAGPHPKLWGVDLWSPWGLLSAWIPGFSAIRTTGRFVVILHLALALLAGLGFERLAGAFAFAGSRRTILTWTAAAVTAIAAVIGFGSLPALPLNPVATGDRVPPAYRWLARAGQGRALLEIPPGDFAGAARRMYLSSYHWLPIVEGYTGYRPTTAFFLQRIAKGLPSRAALQELVDMADIGWIVVHRDQLSPAQRRSWDRLELPGLRLEKDFGDQRVYRVTLRPENDRRARLTSTTETYEGTPIAVLGDTCPGKLRVARAAPDPWPAYSKATINIEIENLGQDAWPAFAVYPRNLVELEVGFGPPGREPRTLGRVRLLGDVQPGVPIRVPWTMRAPVATGDYELVFSLVQTPDSPLARCGVAPLKVPVRVAASEIPAPAFARDRELSSPSAPR